MIVKYVENMGLLEIFIIYILDSVIEVFLASIFFIMPLNEHLYLKIMEFFHFKMMFVILTSVVHTFLYFVSYGFFLICDRVPFFKKYKINQNTSKNAPKSDLIKNTLISAIFGLFIIQPIMLYIIYDSAVYFGLKMGSPLPSFFEAFKSLFIQYHFFEISFYFSHRLLHHPYFYKRYHKQHHMYKEPISISAEHASFVEGLFSSQLPSLITLFSGIHYSIFLSMLILRLYTTYEVHSGYSFPWSLGYRSEYHHFHHSVNIGNYSGAVFLDSLFGTNDAWIQHMENRRKQFNNLVQTKSFDSSSYQELNIVDHSPVVSK